MKKRIVLCADDYGQASAISGAIINLIQNGRLSATSCMVNAADWPEQALWLLPFVAQIDIGLHFNLTEGVPVSSEYKQTYGSTFMTLSGLMRSAFMHNLSLPIITAELNAQIDRFYEAMGFLPEFLDGHQHVHQFPVIRQALIDVYGQRLQQAGTYVRLVNEKFNLADWSGGVKKIIIRASGAGALRQLLIQHNIPHNQSFAGIYAFAKANRFQQFFQRYLRVIGDGGLIMCHPGLSTPGEDAIAAARMAEYQYFNGSQFLIDCHSQGVTLSRFECNQ